MAAPLICMTLTGRSIEENINLVRKYAKYCDIVELRADYLEEDEQLLIRKFPALINKPCILTIRRSSDGGLWTGSEFSRTNLFGRALAFADPDKKRNFAYVDFEEDYHIPSIQDAAMAFGVRIIRSCHNMTEPITNLRKRCDSMRKTGYEIPKIAFMPKTLSDVVNLFHESAHMEGYDHILCAMGAEGFPSRLLSVLSGSYLTYTSPQETMQNTNTIGHIDPVTINELYNFRSITRNTKLYGIAGWPLLKTSSPEIHNTGYKNHNMDAVYFPVRSQLISEALNFAEQLDLKGMSVTIPFKESVIFYLHELSPEVMQIGACNTIVRKNYKWIGYNTDCTGFERALIEFLGNVKTKKMKVAIIGAGGAAKAIAYTVKKLGMKACVFNRTLENAQKLAERYNFEAAALTADSVEMLDEYSSLIIQTTSVGMNSEGPSSSENDPLYFYKFRGNEMVFDIIYTPAATPIMRRASSAGCKVCNGYKMLEYQAYEQFKLFTGEDY